MVWIKIIHQAVKLGLLPSVMLANHIKVLSLYVLVMIQTHGSEYLRV